MENPAQPTLTIEQAYHAAFRFVWQYYQREVSSESLGLMVVSMEPTTDDAKTSDPAGWADWHRCVAETLKCAPVPSFPVVSHGHERERPTKNGLRTPRTKREAHPRAAVSVNATRPSAPAAMSAACGMQAPGTGVVRGSFRVRAPTAPTPEAQPGRTAPQRCRPTGAAVPPVRLRPAIAQRGRCRPAG